MTAVTRWATTNTGTLHLTEGPKGTVYRALCGAWTRPRGSYHLSPPTHSRACARCKAKAPSKVAARRAFYRSER